MDPRSLSGTTTKLVPPREGEHAGQRHIPQKVTDPGALSDTTQAAFPPQFQVFRRLGMGGMAEVFSAIHHEPGGVQRPVVIKKPLPDLAAHPEFLAMFLDEARIASSLQHPNIVRVLEVIHQPDNCLIVMELVDGKSLSALLARLERSGQRLEARLAAFVVARAAQGLHHAHTRTDAEGKPLRIIHRDVSPQNVLVSFTGDIKVIDFGIAHALGRVTQTRTGTRKGKTGYMAPEQARAGAIDSRVDVFALGILLWELSCGRRLFVRPDDFRTMNALLLDPIPLPSSVAAIAPDLENIIMRALSRNPDERFQTADEMRIALDAYVGSLGGAMPAELGALVKVLFANDAPTLRQDSAHEILPAVVTGTTSPMPKRGHDRRQLVMLGAGSLLALSMGAAIGWVGNFMGGKSTVASAARPMTKVAGSVLQAPDSSITQLPPKPIQVLAAPATERASLPSPTVAAPETVSSPGKRPVAAKVAAPAPKPAAPAIRPANAAEPTSPANSSEVRPARPVATAVRRPGNLGPKTNPF
jgi:serine/threonine protein kinase